MANKNGRILYEGPSQINGEPIVVIATGLDTSSKNAKTGDLIQTFIMHADIAPHLATKTGDDEAVCGNCDQRPFNGGACYVVVHHAPLSTWRCYTSGNGYDVFNAESDADLFRGRGLRLGSYGDPAAVPLYVWLELLDLVDYHTGYTHQWGSCDNAFAQIVMASADSEADREAANEKGYRTFRVKPLGDTSKLPGEFVCPASAERNYKTNCNACQACGGWSAKARADVVIQAHGPKGRKWEEA